MVTFIDRDDRYDESNDTNKNNIETVKIFLDVYSKVAKIIPDLILNVDNDIQITYDREYNQFVFKKMCKSGYILEFQDLIDMFLLGDISLDSFTFALK